jgi:hypothetical protein
MMKFETGTSQHSKSFLHGYDNFLGIMQYLLYNNLNPSGKSHLL